MCTNIYKSVVVHFNYNSLLISDHQQNQISNATLSYGITLPRRGLTWVPFHLRAVVGLQKRVRRNRPNFANVLIMVFVWSHSENNQEVTLDSRLGLSSLR